jgi:RNA-directed DNA polymerase
MIKLLRGWLRAGVFEGGIVSQVEAGSPQGGLCAAAHNEPYEQRWVMCSARCLSLVGAVVAVGGCA